MMVLSALRPDAGLFEALCALCAGLGVLAAAGVLLAIWALALDTWIS